MVKSKSDRLALQHKELGNKYYVADEQYKALCEYNKALMYAKSKESLAVLYANRSACFFAVKKYDECLLNIQWARDNDYPAVKIQKLNEREEKCKQLKEDQILDPLDDIRDFLQLSHPPNPKVPFFADCLYLGPTKKNGRRGIFTTRDLMPGDIVSVEAAVFSSAHTEFSHTRCCKCIKVNMMNLIPCTKSASVMFCSEKCRDETYAKVKNLDTMLTNDLFPMNPERLLRECEEAFGGRENLIKFIKETDLKNVNYTVFDFDFSNPNDPDYKANLIKCMLDFDKHSGNANFSLEKISKIEPFVKVAAGNNAHLQKFLTELELIYTTHAQADTLESDPLKVLTAEPYLIQVSPFNTHMNNRCKPNAFLLKGINGSGVCIMRPIKAGEEIFRNFHFSINDAKFEGPMKKLIEMVNAHCECYECINDLPEDIGEPILYQMMNIHNAIEATKEIADFTPQHKKNFAPMIDRIKTNWDILHLYYSGFATPTKAHGIVTQLLGLTTNIMALMGRICNLPCVYSKKLYRELLEYRVL